MMNEHGGADGRHAVAEIVTRLRAAGVTASGLIREADEGHVTCTILDAAAEFDARLIVLGQPRHRLPAGSVANRLIRGSAGVAVSRMAWHAGVGTLVDTSGHGAIPGSGPD